MSAQPPSADLGDDRFAELLAAGASGSAGS